MCFNDNIGFFKLFNVAFLVVHLALLTTCAITYSLMDGVLPVYYKIRISHDQTVDVKLLIVPVLLHTIAAVFMQFF